MYIQITTKCNMTCAHCCYACTTKGRHGNLSTIRDAIDYASGTFGDECVSLGGGEPTLHPHFFEILSYALQSFDFVWLATNGSQTKSMYRLYNIIHDEDMSEDYECNCTEEDIDSGYCTCYEDAAEDLIYSEGKLSITLSLDYYHDEIDQNVVRLWTEQAKNRQSGFAIRNVPQSTTGVINQGRAKKTGAGTNNDECPCSDLFIKPSGKIKPCGCTNAPIIGDIYSGIIPKWEKIIYENEEFSDTKCYKAVKARRR